MQYILAQEEYDKIQPKYIDNSKAYINTLRSKLEFLQKEYAELQDKYNNLLVFRATATNHDLKDYK